VAAGRLSERDEVVLVEAGPFFASLHELPESLRDPYNPDLLGYQWDYQAYHLEPPEERPPGHLPQGRIVGGSSAINGTIGQRASKEDFDDWAAAGNHEWAWEHVLPAYMRIERELDFPDAPYHGTEGPVSIRRLPREAWGPLSRSFEEACLNYGYPRVDDFNAPGAAGVGPAPRNQLGEHRQSTLVTYLWRAQAEQNLTIHANTLARRILFDGNRAVGVEVQSDGKVTQLEADRVVVAAGALRTPHLLMLSGVGPADVLARFSIPVVSELNEVGRNLKDHSIVPVLGLARERGAPRPGLFVELKYASAGASRPDMLIVPGMLEVRSLPFEVDTDATSAVVLSPVLATPKSSGWLTLASPDAAVNPEIHLNFFDQPDDVRRFAEGIRLAYKLTTSPPLADELSTLLFPDAETVEDDERLEGWMRQTVSTAYHVAGTCRLGPDDDPGAVLTQRLAVRGCEGLYVSDGSAMANITTGLVNLTCFMIGERLVTFLSEDER
jgi:choline dehydrogenase